MIKNIAKNVIAALLAIVGGLYAVNCAIIFFAQPANLQQGAREEISSQYGNISVVLLEDLKAGGIGNLSSGTTGYVNVLSSSSTIYLNGTKYKNAPEQNTYIYQHEMAHILQKELIAHKAGGYPSVANPLVSFAYYGELLKLNDDLTALMPKGNQDTDRHSPFAGLEAGADCFAQSGHPEEAMTYVGTDFCSPEQRNISLGLLSNRWPTPLSDEEKIAARIPVNGTAQMPESR